MIFAFSLLESALALFVAAFTGNVVTLDYELRMPGAASATAGRAAFSDTSFRIQDERQEIWCNGSERWIVDHSEGEVCAEPVESLDASSLLKMFTVVSEEPGGKVLLKPVGETGAFLSLLTICFDGAMPSRAEILLEDGGKPVVVVFSGQRIKDPESESFTFDPGTVPEGYVITDLR